MKRISVGVLCVTLFGCAPIQINNKLVPMDGQTLEYLQGAPYTRSIAANSAVILMLKNQSSLDGDRVQLNIAAINTGQSALNFGLENISVKDERGELLTLVPFEEIAEEIQGQIRGKQFAANYMAFQALNARSTTTTQHYGSYTGSSNFNANTYGSYGYANTSGNIYGSGTYSGQSVSSTVNPAQNSAAASAWLQQGEAATTSLESKLEAISATYLRTNTVQPGNSTEGFVYVTPSYGADAKKPDTYTITVVIGADRHTFLMKRLPQL